MSKKKGVDEERRKSFAPDLPLEPPGAFVNGRRLMSPTGRFVAPQRPISQLASRIRGVCGSSREAVDVELSPRSVSAGGVRQVLSATSSLGRYVNLPRELLLSRNAATPLLHVRRFVDAPDLARLSSWMSETRTLTKCRGAGMLHLAPHARAVVDRLFDPTTGAAALHRAWQRRCLSSANSLEELPVVAAAIENVTEQPQLARVATLLHALLQFKSLVEAGAAPPVRHGKELGNMESMRHLFNFTIGPDSSGVDRPQYHEATRHVVVAHRGQFYEFEVIEPEGRLLVASEIHRKLQLIAANAPEPSCALPIHALSSLPREDFRRVAAEMATQCAANRIALQVLDSAICIVGISDDASETLESPSLGVPRHEARWLGKSCSLQVFPNGNALLRCSGLLLDVATVSACAKWVANAANCDPMLQPPSSPVETLQATRRTPRTPTPTGGQSKRPPKGKAQPVVEEVPEVAQVAITMPQPQPAAEPRALQFWMPATYCQSFAARPANAPRLVTFDLSVRDESALHLGCILAMHYVDASRLPTVHIAKYSALRDPAVYPTMSRAVEAALRYIEQFTQFGPLRTEVNAACIAAVQELKQALAEPHAAPHVSDMHALFNSGAVLREKHAHDFDDGNVFGPPQLVILREEHQPELLWTLEANLFPPREAPMTMSYIVAPAHRSSLRNTLGGIVTCTVTQPEQTGRSEVDLERFAGAVKLFTKFVDECVAVASKPRSLSQLRASTPVISAAPTPEPLRI